MNDLENYIKVNLDLYLEEPNTHHSEIELVKALCFAFDFRYKTLSPSADTLLVEIYFSADSNLFFADFSTIIKTFALQRNYHILSYYPVKLPYSEAICLDENTEN